MLLVAFLLVAWSLGLSGCEKTPSQTVVAPQEVGPPQDVGHPDSGEKSEDSGGVSSDSGPDTGQPADVDTNLDMDVDSSDTGSFVDASEPPPLQFGGPLPFDLGPKRPYLLFSIRELPSIRRRATSDHPIYRNLWNRVEALCARTFQTRPDPHIYAPEVETYNANIAKACAFHGLVTDDSESLRKATKALLKMKTDVRNTPITPDRVDKSTIYGGPTVMGYAFAFDMLLARPEQAFASSSERSEAQRLLLEHADNVMNFYVEVVPGLLALTRNNHNIKHASGIGMAALAVPDDPGALHRLSFGVTETVYHLFNSQALPGGGFAEGPGYLQYSAVSYLPFLYNLHRVLNGQSMHLLHTCASRTDADCHEHVAQVADPWHDSRFLELHRWAFHMTMPNGYMVPFDDSKLATFPWPYLHMQHANGPWLWHFIHGAAPGQAVAAIDLAPDYLSMPLDDALTSPMEDPAALEPLNALFYEGGQAVLRTGFGRFDSYMMLLGEHGAARMGGHEHPDATSFSWFAAGQYAFIDTGYPGWTTRMETAVAHQHNLVLVNGEGPPQGLRGFGAGVDSHLHGCEMADTPLPSCAVSSTYANTDVVRRVVMVGERAIVVADDLEPLSGEPSQFTHLLHGGTQPQSTDLLQHGARWRYGSLAFDATVALLEGDLGYTIEERTNAVTHPRHHALLLSSSDVSAHGRAGYLTLLHHHTKEEEDGGNYPTHTQVVRREGGQVRVELHDDDGLLLAATLERPEAGEPAILSVSAPARPEGILGEDLPEDVDQSWQLQHLD